MIVTIDSPNSYVLQQSADPITDWGEAHLIADLLLKAITPHLPAAGLAAPQIGISKAIFIYSYDRDPKNLQVVINPSYTPLTDEKIFGWEGCFSVLLARNLLVKIGRYKKISATYFNLEGVKIEKVLSGFPSKVFQHEWDHLQGIITLNKEGSEVKEFANAQDMNNFFEIIKKEDTKL